MPVADLLTTLSLALPGVTIDGADAVDQPSIVVPAEALVATARALRDTPELNFHFLAEMTGVDWWPKEPRFEVVYHLACVGVPDFPRPGMSGPARRLRMKVRVPGDRAQLASLIEVWPNANWYEREVYDLFGIIFEGHPDLRRLLMPEEWEGHPARKDYPVQIKTPVAFGMPTQVTEEEFVRNIEAQRVRVTRS
jgi:NADH-quinone oxidoreductase subunit C